MRVIARRHPSPGSRSVVLSALRAVPNPLDVFEAEHLRDRKLLQVAERRRVEHIRIK